jgi:hypothetical protein
MSENVMANSPIASLVFKISPQQIMRWETPSRYQMEEGNGRRVVESEIAMSGRIQIVTDQFPHLAVPI